MPSIFSSEDNYDTYSQNIYNLTTDISNYDFSMIKMINYLKEDFSDNIFDYQTNYLTNDVSINGLNNSLDNILNENYVISTGIQDDISMSDFNQAIKDMESQYKMIENKKQEYIKKKNNLDKIIENNDTTEASMEQGIVDKNYNLYIIWCVILVIIIGVSFITIIEDRDKMNMGTKIVFLLFVGFIIFMTLKNMLTNKGPNTKKKIEVVVIKKKNKKEKDEKE
tara:strand:- start:9 stop:677 length:669 start_codon:yes stop_codon:yes gene_type:complete